MENNINENQLKEGMKLLLNNLISIEEKNPSEYKKIIAKAVNLGMIYQENKIKQKIDNIFKN